MLAVVAVNMLPFPPSRALANRTPRHHWQHPQGRGNAVPEDGGPRMTLLQQDDEHAVCIRTMVPGPSRLHLVSWELMVVSFSCTAGLG